MSNRSRRFSGAIALIAMLTGVMNSSVAALVVCPMDMEAGTGCCCCGVEGFDGLSVAAEPFTCCPTEASDPPAIPVPAVMGTGVEVVPEPAPTEHDGGAATPSPVQTDAVAFTPGCHVHPPPSQPVFRLTCALLI